MARNKKNYWIIAGVLIAGCLVGVLGLLWTALSVPPISVQLAENRSRLSAQIVHPLPYSEWPLNSFIPMQVTAYGAEPIRHVELYINNVLLSTKDGGLETFGGVWMWQPGVAGDFVVSARVVGESGAASLSNPTRIRAIAAGYTTSPRRAHAGETLAGIAGTNGIPLEWIEVSNPGIDPLQSLDPQQQIFIPNDPAPIVNDQIIEPLPETDSEDANPPAEPAGSGEESPSGQGTTIFDAWNFKFQLQQVESAQPGGDQSAAGQDPAAVPNAPELQGDFSKCDVKLRIGGGFYDPPDSGYVKMNEDGFFVYRSRDGSAFERIFTVAPIHDFKDDKNHDFVDPNQYGEVSYYVSAFNVLGESASNPVTIPLDAAACKSPGRGSPGGEIRLQQDGDLILPFKMDLAYLYLQINGSKAIRIPGGDRSFLPASGVSFNISSYLDSLIDDLPAADLSLHMEVWGWSGGSLIFVGEFDTMVHRTILTICSVPGEGGCSGSGGGKWVRSLNLPQDKPLKDLIYEVHWQVTSLTSVERLHVALSASPFTGTAWNASPKLLYARRWWAKGTEGVFPLYLGSILYPEPPYPNSELGSDHPSDPFDFTSNGFLQQPPGQPFTLYLRMTPWLVMKGLSDISNAVPLMYNTSPPPSELPPLASPYPSIYTVEILEDTYKPPSFYDHQMWGCVVIEEDPTGQFPSNEDYVVCPGKNVGFADPCAGKSEAICLLEFGVESLGWVFDQVAMAYELYIQEVVKGLQYLIPGCDESEFCRDAVKTTVETAWTAVSGLPADLPSSDELIADSVAQTIVQSAAALEKSYSGQDESAIALFCEKAVDCEKEISESIQDRLKHARAL
ncbi:MAG: hypothetical protein V1755_06370, partial [Chloroflexota bacterium]